MEVVVGSLKIRPERQTGGGGSSEWAPKRRKWMRREIFGPKLLIVIRRGQTLAPLVDMWPSSSFLGGPSNEPSRLSSCVVCSVKGEMAPHPPGEEVVVVLRLLFNSWPQRKTIIILIILIKSNICVQESTPWTEDRQADIPVNRVVPISGTRTR